MEGIGGLAIGKENRERSIGSGKDFILISLWKDLLVEQNLKKIFSLFRIARNRGS